MMADIYLEKPNSKNPVISVLRETQVGLILTQVDLEIESMKAKEEAEEAAVAKAPEKEKDPPKPEATFDEQVIISDLKLVVESLKSMSSRMDKIEEKMPARRTWSAKQILKKSLLSVKIAIKSIPRRLKRIPKKVLQRLKNALKKVSKKLAPAPAVSPEAATTPPAPEPSQSQPALQQAQLPEKDEYGFHALFSD
jgi:hypothetical protein